MVRGSDVPAEGHAWCVSVTSGAQGAPHPPPPIPLVPSSRPLAADAADRFVAALKKQPLEAVFFDFPGSAALAERLLASRNGGGAAAAAAAAAAADEGSSKSSGAAQAIAWQGDGAAPVLPAWAFAHAFFGLLRVSGVTVSEVGVDEEFQEVVQGTRRL